MENKKSYYIKVEYTTGDSFNTYETSEDIDLPWYNIDIINENVKRLKEQVDLYNFINSWQTNASDAIEKWANKDWAVINEKKPKFSLTPIKTKDGKYLDLYSIKLLKDDRTEFQIGTIEWMGYFESNQYFSIEEVNLHVRNEEEIH